VISARKSSGRTARKVVCQLSTCTRAIAAASAARASRM
jgi:hypothetical protein